MTTTSSERDVRQRQLVFLFEISYSKYEMSLGACLLIRLHIFIKLDFVLDIRVFQPTFYYIFFVKAMTLGRIAFRISGDGEVP